jgi:hypothetical protein
LPDQCFFVENDYKMPASAQQIPHGRAPGIVRKVDTGGQKHGAALKSRLVSQYGVDTPFLSEQSQQQSRVELALLAGYGQVKVHCCYVL